MQIETERRVGITGLGVVAPNGIGKEAFWHATSRGTSGIKPVSRHPAPDLSISVAGEISDFVAHDYIERKLINRTDRMTHFAIETLERVVAATPSFWLARTDLARAYRCAGRPEAAREELTGELSQQIIGEVVKQLRDGAKLERFNMDGTARTE